MLTHPVPHHLITKGLFTQFVLSNTSCPVIRKNTRRTKIKKKKNFDQTEHAPEPDTYMAGMLELSH